MITIDPDEKIHLTTRRHRYILLRLLIPEVLFFAVVLIGMIIVLIIKLPAWPDFLVDSFSPIIAINLRLILLFLLAVFLQFLWLAIFLTIVNYYFDCWIITNKRTIHTELRALFSRIYSSVSHKKIQDITVDIHGIFPTVMRYGDLKIQTAGGFREFIFKEIPEPYKAKDIILRAKSELNEEK